MKKERIDSLDYLRGICAFLIMIYHYMTFSDKKGYFVYSLDVSYFINKMAIYGVSIFYILSGATLFYIYKDVDYTKLSNVRSFFRKRFLRIIPLFSLLTVLLFLISRDFSQEKIIALILNITGLFSVFAYDKYFLVGGWSIGNELAFYLCFPLVVYLLRKFNRFLLFYLLSFVGYVYFAFFILDIEKGLSDNWHNYINPLNQIFLFLSGILVSYAIASKQASKQAAGFYC